MDLIQSIILIILVTVLAFYFILFLVGWFKYNWVRRLSFFKIIFLPKRWQPHIFAKIIADYQYLSSLNRVSHARKKLMAFYVDAFWLPVFLIVLLWLFFWPWNKYLDLKPYPKSFEPVTSSNLDWESIRQTALNRTTITNFRKAKKKLYPIYAKLNLERTFYCDCKYSRKKPDLASCGVTPKKDVKRMNRTEAEHVMPISLLGHTLDCWSNGGRRNCGKVDDFFKRAEGDLHNLVPALGEVNGNRSNYPPVEEIVGEARKYGDCDVEIHKKQFEPPPHRRGDIARAYLYMWKIYNTPLTNDDVKMFQAWHQEDPPDADERQIHEAKTQIQGNVNPYYE